MITNDGRITTAPTCPCCNKLLDGFTAMKEGERPSVGDASICMYCFEYLEFTHDLQLIKMSGETLAEIDLIQLQKARDAVMAVQASYPQSRG